MYNHLFLPHCGHSSGTAWKGHHMTSHPWGTPQHFIFQKYLFSSIQIIHTILSCQIKKIYGGSLLGFFFSLQKKGTLKPLKSTGKTVKNTGSNINTISAYTKWTLISNTILNTGKKVDHKCVLNIGTYMSVQFPKYFKFSLYIYIS